MDIMKYLLSITKSECRHGEPIKCAVVFRVLLASLRLITHFFLIIKFLFVLLPFFVLFMCWLVLVWCVSFLFVCFQSTHSCTIISKVRQRWKKAWKERRQCSVYNQPISAENQHYNQPPGILRYSRTGCHGIGDKQYSKLYAGFDWRLTGPVFLDLAPWYAAVVWSQ